MSTKTLKSLRSHAEESVNPPVDRRAGKMSAGSDQRQVADSMLTWIHQFMAEPLAESKVQMDALTNALPSLKCLLDCSSFSASQQLH